MKKTISFLTLFAIGMLILSACAPQAAQANTPTPQPPTSTPVDPAAGGSKTVTLEDQGKTISLTVGDRFLLKLGEEYTWEITLSDQTVVSRVKNVMVIRGAQGLYDALKAGTATLTAAGDPVCRQAQPACGAPSILFSITILVQ